MLPFVTGDQVKKYVAQNGGGAAPVGGGLYELLGTYAVTEVEEQGSGSSSDPDYVWVFADATTAPTAAQIDAKLAEGKIPVLHLVFSGTSTYGVTGLNTFLAFRNKESIIANDDEEETFYLFGSSSGTGYALLDSTYGWDLDPETGF